jgi:hypothetical protein
MSCPALVTDYFPDGLQPSQSPAPFRVPKRVGEPTTVELGAFTKIPNKFFGSGQAHELKPSASLLYLALCEHANRNGSNTFKASDKALASETTLSTRTICDARKRLVEKGLITVTLEPGQSYFYTLTVPSLEWVPLAKRPRGKLKPRGYHGRPDSNADK